MIEARLDRANRKARIETPKVSMELDMERGMRLSRLTYLPRATEWVPQSSGSTRGDDVFHEALVTRSRWDIWPDLCPPSAEYLLRYREMDASADSLTATEVSGTTPSRLVADRSAATITDSEAGLDVTVAPEGHALEITIHTRVHAATGLVRRSATVRNTGHASLRLERFTSLLLSVRPSAADLELTWVEAFVHPSVSMAAARWRQAAVRRQRLGPLARRTLRYGLYPRPSEDGSLGCLGWAALHDPTLRQGMYMGWLWSGLFDVAIGDFAEGAGVFGVRAGVSDEGGYWRELKPGDELRTPETFFGFYEGEAEEAAPATRLAAETHFALPWPDGRPPMFIGYDTWSNWQDFPGSVHHLRPDRLPREIEICRRLGVELLILDYDWFPRVGDWWSDPERFPDGVEAVARKVKDAGMRFGLWMGFGQAHPESRVAREHPEWLVTREGKPFEGGWNLLCLCLGYPPCRDWVLEQISGAVSRFGVEWLKHDFDLIPVSDARHHAPHASDSRVETVEGFYFILDRLHERFPGLYLDNWTPPAGGADFGLFARHHSMMTQDWYTPVSLRGMLAGLTHLFPPTRLHAYVRGFTQTEERDPTTYRSAFFGNGLSLLNDPLQWDEQTLKIIERQIARVKIDRELFLDGAVHDLLDTPPGHWGWEARSVYSASRGRGMTQVFRNNDGREELPVRFRGLEPAATFKVEREDAGSTMRASGSALMDVGVVVRVPRPFGSEVVRLTREQDPL
jgi:hypothetical protein